MGQALSDELIALRQRSRISQRDLARLTGVSEGTIKNIEAGQNTQPRPQTLRALADGLATDGAGNKDESLAEEYYDRLATAAGYAPAKAIQSEQSPTHARTQLYDLLVKNPEVLRAFERAAFSIHGPFSERGAQALIYIINSEILGQKSDD